MGGGKRAHGRPGSNLGAALKSARDKKNAGHRKVHDKDHGEHLHVSEVHQVHFFYKLYVQLVSIENLHVFSSQCKKIRDYIGSKMDV